MNRRPLATLAFVALTLFAFAAKTPAQQTHLLQSHAGSVMSECFAPDGKTLATSSRDGKIKLWDVATGQLLRTLEGHTSDVFCVTYSPDGALLASSSGDMTIKLWDTKSFAVVREIKGHTGHVRWVAFSHDGKLLASVGGDSTVRIWNAASGTELHVMTGHGGVVKMVRFTTDDKLLVTCGSDGTVRTWDVQSGKPVALLAGHTSSIEGVSISADGKWLVSSSNDNSIRTWNAADGSPQLLILGHVGEVDSVTFAPDSKMIISGSKDKSIRFWDIATGRQLATLTGHTGRIESMEISPDGKTLATGGGGGDTSVRLWDLSKVKFVTAPLNTEPPVPLAGRDIVAPSPISVENEVNQLWRLLGNDDGDDNGVASQRLVAMGDPAIPLLAKRLGTLAESPTPGFVAKLISELESRDPLVRERATCDLIQAGDAIVGPVTEALKAKPSPIVKHRLEMALRDVSTKAPAGDLSAAYVLRDTYAVKVLSQIGTPAAKAQLAAWSKGDPSRELTKQAQATLSQK